MLLARAVFDAFTSHDSGPGFLTVVGGDGVPAANPAHSGSARTKPEVQQRPQRGVATDGDGDGISRRGWHHRAPTSAAPLVFASLAAFLLGGMFYALLAALITYRFAFTPMSATDLEGPWGGSTWAPW